MDEQRDEIYERIPWETLEKPRDDRQWWVMGVAAAVVVGALAYSFMSNRSVTPQAAPVVASVDDPAAAPTFATPPPAPADALPAPAPVASTPPTTLPGVLAEADLYAVPPQLVRDAVVAHAEWFIAEYLTADGTDEGSDVLRLLLPADIPLPELPADTVVFVEWVRALDIVEAGPGRFTVSVLARYMVAAGGEPYQRVDPEIFTVDMAVGGTGAISVTAPPSARPIEVETAPAIGIVELPVEISTQMANQRPGAVVLGGVPNPDGSWTVSFLNPGPGGVSRPESMVIRP